MFSRNPPTSTKNALKSANAAAAAEDSGYLLRGREGRLTNCGVSEAHTIIIPFDVLP